MNERGQLDKKKFAEEIEQALLRLTYDDLYSKCYEYAELKQTDLDINLVIDAKGTPMSTRAGQSERLKFELIKLIVDSVPDPVRDDAQRNSALLPAGPTIKDNQLQSAAQNHEDWILGAFQELIHNASDAGAKKLQIVHFKSRAKQTFQTP